MNSTTHSAPYYLLPQPDPLSLLLITTTSLTYMNYMISLWHLSIPIVPILWISQCTSPSLNNVHIITFIHLHELYNSLTTLLPNVTIRSIIVTPNCHHLSYMNELHEITITLINTYFTYLVDTQYTSSSPINIRDGPGLGGTFCDILSFELKVVFLGIIFI